MARLHQKKLEEREKLIHIQHYYNESSKPSLRISAETYSIAWTTLRGRLNGAKTVRNGPGHDHWEDEEHRGTESEDK